MSSLSLCWGCALIGCKRPQLCSRCAPVELSLGVSVNCALTACALRPKCQRTSFLNPRGNPEYCEKLSRDDFKLERVIVYENLADGHALVEVEDDVLLTEQGIKDGAQLVVQLDGE